VAAVISRIEYAVTQQVDAIVINVDPAQIAAGLIAAKDAGIPVVGMGSGNDPLLVANVTSNGYAMAAETTAYVVNRLDSASRVVMFVFDAFPSVQVRGVIADAIFANTPDIEIIDRVTPDVADGGNFAASMAQAFACIGSAAADIVARTLAGKNVRERSRGTDARSRPSRIKEPSGQNREFIRLDTSQTLSAFTNAEGDRERERDAMAFRIHALPAQPFREYFTMTTRELAERRACLMRVGENPGLPCSVSLQDARLGETVLLVNHEHQPAATPFRDSHAIFVGQGVEQEAEDALGPALPQAR